MSNFNKPTNPPAFPVQFQGTTEPILSGMTLRDYFAARAMQAYIPDAIQKSALMKDVATEAYWYADEMLKARKA
jgi:hypothetical protein